MRCVRRYEGPEIAVRKVRVEDLVHAPAGYSAQMLALLLACAPAKTGLDDTGTESPLSDTAEDTATTADTADTSGTTNPADVAWDQFLAAREDSLRALGVPILECVARDDNSHAAFDGCYDWHSAVHGHWALLALARLLDDPAYLDLVDAQLTEEDLAIELDAIADVTLNEVPYGYAWFLLLATERGTLGDTDLLPLAEAAAEVLDAHLSSLPAPSIRAAALADDYQNASWAALNLWRWAVLQGDTERATRVEEFVRLGLVPLDDVCPLADDISDTDDFFPACLMRAHAILTVLPEGEVDTWLAGALPDTYDITPVTQITSAHTSGLNFSRTWGMWSLYMASGDSLWRDRVREHIEWQLAHPEYWAEDYAAYSHWVPQFGVYAIALTYESP